MTVVVLICLFLFFTKPTHAYLDPGTGSLLFQFVIAGFLSSLFLAKKTYKRIIRFLVSLFQHDRHES